MTISKKIKARINGYDENYVFTIADFSDIAVAKTVSKTLDRLCGSLEIKKLARGLFCKYSANALDPGQVAFAIARANNWTIVPCGDTAKYFFGLIPAPKKWSFVTNGTYRDYTFKDFTISFRHTSDNMMTKISKTTALVVQVIKSYGQGRVPARIKEKLSRFTEREKQILRKEATFITEWIAVEIKKCL